jgi:hypothetical protein
MFLSFDAASFNTTLMISGGCVERHLLILVMKPERDTEISLNLYLKADW